MSSMSSSYGEVSSRRLTHARKAQCGWSKAQDTVDKETLNDTMTKATKKVGKYDVICYLEQRLQAKWLPATVWQNMINFLAWRLTSRYSTSSAAHSRQWSGNEPCEMGYDVPELGTIYIALANRNPSHARISAGSLSGEFGCIWDK